MITSAIRGGLTCSQKFVRDTRLSLTNIGNPMARCFLVPSLKQRAEMVKTISISLQKRNSFFQGAPSPSSVPVPIWLWEFLCLPLDWSVPCSFRENEEQTN